MKGSYKIIGLENWRFEMTTDHNEAVADVNITLKYPKIKKAQYDLTPKERVGFVDGIYQENFSRLMSLRLFEKYKITGSKNRPISIRAKLPLSALNSLATKSYIAMISVEEISGASEVKSKNMMESRLYCVKMTVAIQIEGIESGYQTYEERFALVNALSHEDAYRKLEKSKNQYAVPYLNSEGRLVRWKIESFDDCYEVGNTESLSDIDSPLGLEVYSVLKRRKLRTDRIRDGKN